MSDAGPKKPAAEVACNHCGAAAKPRGFLEGKDPFIRSAKLVMLLWISCPNCGQVTQPAELPPIVSEVDPKEPRSQAKQARNN